MQREIASEQELNFKKRARRRLVGAIALVLLMIAVLPVVLKDRQEANAPEKITITLPSEQLTSEPTDFDSNIAPDEAILALPETEQVAKEVMSEHETANTNSPSESIESKTDASSNLAINNKTPTVESVKEVNKTSTAEKNRFYVQVGVFSDLGNVKKLQAKLTDLGYKSQTEKINTEKGQKFRLRTQVFLQRNDAAVALQNIKDAGLTGMVVSQ